MQVQNPAWPKLGLAVVSAQQYWLLSLPLMRVGLPEQGLFELIGAEVPAVPGAGPDRHCVPEGGATHVTLACTVPVQGESGAPEQVDTIPLVELLNW